MRERRLYHICVYISGVSKAQPSRAGALPNIQSAHPTPWAKNLGKKGLMLKVNLTIFYILAS